MIASVQQPLSVRAARHYFAIDLDGDAAIRISGMAEQVVHAGLRVDFVRFAVEEDLQHPRIVVVPAAFAKEGAPAYGGRSMYRRNAQAQR